MRKTILVIDDDYDLREALKDLLSDEGYPIVTACDGAKALEHLRAHPPPALILLDYWMPHVNGEAVYAELKRMPAWAHIPVALVTADAKATEIAAHLGVDAVLKKPIDVEALFQLAERFAGG